MILAALLASATLGVFADTWAAKRRGRKARAAEAKPRPLEEPRDEPPVPAPVASAADAAIQSNRLIASGGVLAGLSAIGAFMPIPFLGAPAAVTYGAMPLFRAGIAKWRQERRFGIDLLNSTLVVMLLATQAFAVTGLAFFVLAIRQRLYLATMDRAKRDLRDVFGTRASTAWVIQDGQEVEMPVERIAAGTEVAVHAGEMIPIDGVVTAGAGRVDQHALTGEDRIVELLPGAPAFAATRVVSGRLVIRMEHAGASTTVEQIVQRLDRTTEHRLTVQARGERLADSTAPYRLAAGIAVLPFLGLYRAAAAMTILPGEMFAIAAPLGVLHALRMAARRGIVVLDGRTLEALPEVDTVVFDKTGTLTDPVPCVTRIACSAGIKEHDALRWAASAEHRQTHPVALAIRAEAERRSLRTDPPDNVDYAVSNGVQATVEGAVTHVGSARYMAMMNIHVPAQAAGAEIVAQQAGESAIHVARSGMHVAAIVLRTAVRREARAVVAALHARGLRVHVISGDGAAQTQAIARDLGADTYDAAVLPGEKADIIARMQQQGRFVCFIGDGINDVVAMRQAHVSMAVAGARTAATAVAGVLLLSGDLRRVIDLFGIAETFARRMRQSTVVTTVPGIVAACAIVPLGGGFASAMLLNQLIFASGLVTMVRPWPGDAVPPERPEDALAPGGDAAF